MLRYAFTADLLIFVINSYADELAPKAATHWTKQINQSFVDQLPFYNKQDFSDAKKWLCR